MKRTVCIITILLFATNIQAEQIFDKSKYKETTLFDYHIELVKLDYTTEISLYYKAKVRFSYYYPGSTDYDFDDLDGKTGMHFTSPKLLPPLAEKQIVVVYFTRPGGHQELLLWEIIFDAIEIFDEGDDGASELFVLTEPQEEVEQEAGEPEYPVQAPAEPIRQDYPAFNYGPDRWRETMQQNTVEPQKKTDGIRYILPLAGVVAAAAGWFIIRQIKKRK